MTTNQTMQKALRQLVANDAYAMTFQTVGEYRSALLHHVDGLLQAPATCSQVHPESALPPIADYDTTAQQYAALSLRTQPGVAAPGLTQLTIALGKYASGYRPGMDGWTKEDDEAMLFAQILAVQHADNGACGDGK